MRLIALILQDGVLGVLLFLQQKDCIMCVLLYLWQFVIGGGKEVDMQMQRFRKKAEGYPALLDKYWSKA